MADSVTTEPAREQPAVEPASQPSGQQITPPRRSSLLTVTNALIVINVLVFLAMVVSGVSFFSPTPLQALDWGADFGPVTFGQGQIWRLLTACFVHYGIIHIGFNMFVLYQIGPFIEKVFGPARYLIIYILAGVSGSLVSIWIHPNVVGAGASGAIFGLYGAVFGFLLRERKTLDPAATKSIAKSAGIFLLYNLVYGSFSGTTDLSAHFGGLIGGFLIGVLLVRRRLPAAQLTS